MTRKHNQLLESVHVGASTMRNKLHKLQIQTQILSRVAVNEETSGF